MDKEGKVIFRETFLSVENQNKSKAINYSPLIDTGKSLAILGNKEKPSTGFKSKNCDIISANSLIKCNLIEEEKVQDSNQIGRIRVNYFRAYHNRLQKIFWKKQIQILMLCLN